MNNLNQSELTLWNQLSQRFLDYTLALIEKVAVGSRFPFFILYILCSLENRKAKRCAKIIEMLPVRSKK